MNKDQLIKSLIILFIVIVGSAILVRSFSSGQTITDYANENNIPTHSQNVDEEENADR